MSITGAELISAVKVTGAAEAEAQLLGVGTSFKALDDMSRMAAQNASQALGGLPRMVTPVSSSLKGAEANMLSTRMAAAGMGSAAANMGRDVEGASLRVKLLEGASKAAGMAMEALKLAAIGLAVIGVIAVGIGLKAAEMAGNFQQATSTLVTSAGLSKNSIDAVRAGILKMSVDTATSWQDLNKGMFNVQSALHLGASGLLVLKAAAEGAKAENSDLAATTDVLTTAMVNYKIPASQAVATMNSLISTVANGKMHMDDLTGSLKNVLPVAAAFGIHLSDVEGALATMANAGDRGTDAGTHLAMMFKMLEKPIGSAKKEMADMGLDSLKLARTMQTSLPDAMKMIQDAVSAHFKPGTAEYNRAILDILGGSKSGAAGLEIFNQGLKTLGKNTDDAAGALHKGSKDVENWDVIQGNFNFKLDAAKNAVEALFIKLGTALLPALGKLMDFVTPLITRFSDWVGKSGNVQGALDRVVSALKPLIDAGKEIWKQLEPVLKQLGEWAIKNDVAGKAVTFMKGAIVVLAEVLKVVIPIIISVVVELIKFGAAIVERLMPKILELAAFIKTHWEAIKAITQGMWDQISGIIQIAWSIIKGIILIAIDLVTGQWGQAWSDFKDMLNGVWEGIKKVILGGVKFILGALALIPGPIGDMAKNALKIIDGLTSGVSDKTKQMKIDAIQHTIDMQKGMNAQAQLIADGLKDKIQKTKDPVVKKMLEMKLESVQHVIDMRDKSINAMQGMKDQIVGHSIIPDMVSGIGTWLGKLPGMAGSWISKMAGNVLSGLGSLASSAYSAGSSIVSNIANGILNNIGSFLGNAMGAVGDFISSHLPHSPAKVGPLRDLELQGREIIAQLSKGMRGALPTLQATLQVGLSPLVSSGNLNAGPGLNAAYALRQAASGGGQTIIINVPPSEFNVDGYRLVGTLMPHIYRKLAYNT